MDKQELYSSRRYDSFFDWNNEKGQDGSANHVGIVQKVENGKVYIIEGNTSDSCKVREYSLDYYEIWGYGVLCP